MLARPGCAQRGQASTAARATGLKSVRSDGGVDLRPDAGFVDAHQGAQVRDRAVVDELAVGQTDALHRREWLRFAGVGKDLQHGRAEASREHALLERDDELLAAGSRQDELAVERAGEASVHDADRPAGLRQAVGDGHAAGDDRVRGR